MTEQQQLEAAIAALEGQRSTLGQSAVESLLSAARARLEALEPLDAAPNAPVQTLRQVSILFMDVVGSTALSQQLDPEAISAVMDGALSRATAVVQAHGGKVLQYAGDNLLAVFGAAEAREDDTQQAVRCGLTLLELGKLLGADVHAAHGHAGFDVRAGVHTGAVLLGGGVDADSSIRGIAVNIAARMEQTAPAGALRISHDAHAQVRGLFEVERQAPIAVKGIDEPVQSYLVLRARPRSFHAGSRGIEGVSTRMIGRDAELEALQDAFKRLFIDRQLAAITVVADAGIGKSRLLREFSAWCDARAERFIRFRGRATPQTQGQPYGLLRDLIAWHFRIADDDSVEAARRKMEERIVPLYLDECGPDEAQAQAHLLGHLIGIEWRDSRHVRGIVDDTKQIRDRAFHAAAQLFGRIAGSERAAVVLELEDLHWADNESLDFLAYLAEVDRDLPLLMVACSRPALFERRASWCAERVHRRIDLQPLGRDMSRLLAGELLAKLAEVPAALRELVIGGAGAGWARPSWRSAGTPPRRGPSHPRRPAPSKLRAPYRYDAAAGLARLALAHADTGAAMKAVEPLCLLGAAGVAVDRALEGVEFPRQVEWTCRRVLARVGDPRSAEWLARAHQALAQQAGAIEDAALRERFLFNIPVHREIVAAWAQEDATG